MNSTMPFRCRTLISHLFIFSFLYKQNGNNFANKLTCSCSVDTILNASQKVLFTLSTNMQQLIE